MECVLPRVRTLLWLHHFICSTRLLTCCWDSPRLQYSCLDRSLLLIFYLYSLDIFSFILSVLFTSIGYSGWRWLRQTFIMDVGGEAQKDTWYSHHCTTPLHRRHQPSFWYSGMCVGELQAIRTQSVSWTSWVTCTKVFECLWIFLRTWQNFARGILTDATE